MKKLSWNKRQIHIPFSNKYTVLTMFLVVVFSLASMAGMNLILRAREHQLLSAHGEITTGNAIYEWQKRENISIAQMEEAISNWEEYKMIAHTPVNRQISMEEAVKAGKVWLTRMKFVGYNWEEDANTQIHSVHATLGAQKELEEIQIHPYYSFWKVNISGHSLGAVLYINAVTAQVWRAELTFYENLPEEMPYWKLKEFIELSGINPHYEGAVRNEEGTKATWEVEDSRLYAWMDFSYREANGYRKELTGIDKDVINDDVIMRECVQLNMGLKVRQEAKTGRE